MKADSPGGAGAAPADGFPPQQGPDTQALAVAAAQWHGGPLQWALVLQGCWVAGPARSALRSPAGAPAQGQHGSLPAAPPTLPTRPQPAAFPRLPPLPPSLAGNQALPAGLRVSVDGQALGAWDSTLAAHLWALADQLQRRGAHVSLDTLPAGLGELLALAEAPAGPAHPPKAPDRAAVAGRAGPATNTRPTPPAHGAKPAAGLSGAMLTLAFFGEVLIAMGRWLRGRTKLRAANVLQQLDLTGPRSLSIVVLSCALIGLMLAYMGGAQLGRIGAQNYLADVVTVGMVRELAGLMTGIILAGRVGSAFAAQLATMQAGEEIDALRVLGIDPTVYLVLPRLLALLLVAPVLIGLGAVAGVLAGWVAAVGAYGLTTAEYFQQSHRALTFTHVWIGLFKGLLYAGLVGLAGCREGLHAGRSAQAVGEATTAAVVKALVWIVAAACATTVVFTNLGY